ncbi:26039_t:CDS:2 [Gigaspora margarita]|uniref:DNA topoisomerase 1 n=1 Tax=Gigaspora margarita TaxID=4874 RepID=A0ABM8VVR0_GIGMA|nr:26039_t:CDS:2 [Gigaspora margarita]
MTNKWETLSHNGIYFWPSYTRLPPTIHLLYNNIPVRNMSLEAEEFACYFANLADNHATNVMVRNNFFADWKPLLTDTIPQIDDLDKCVFSVIKNYIKTTGHSKYNIDGDISNYEYVVLNGNKEKLKNCKVERPGIYIYSGPLSGKIKRRITPEDVTINIGKESEIPNPPDGHKWGRKHPVTGKDTEIIFSPDSKVKHLAHESKFNKALELGKHIDSIHIRYERDLISDNNVNREKATILYLIDRYGFRIGKEKDITKEPDTVGCSTFKSSNVILDDHSKSVIISFVGKSNVQCSQLVVENRIYENMQRFKAGKKSQDNIFSVKHNDVNDYISSFEHGFTSKIFRTYHASRIYNEYLCECANQTSIGFNIKHELAAKKALRFCKHEEFKTVIKNYIDPRITSDWCNKHKFPFKDLYNKSTYKILKWAENLSNISYLQNEI